MLCTCVSAQLFAQTTNSETPKELTYYLPDLDYNPNITTPEEFLGWQIGDWHISHDLQQAYMRLLASQSDRMTLEEIGRSYEDRPLLNLIVTSPENQGRLEDMREQHYFWSSRGSGVKESAINNVPAVLYQGFSIHGNEPSGGNAAPLVAYYLAAAPYSAVAKVLDDNIVLFDPCYNPDGFNRFASWVNSHKNKTMTADGADREYNEAYPRGRTNHYWFDLNRDWLPVQHPESRARIKQFHEWRPNVLTDHHEMGKDATFFFMPGEPTRVHPMTPKVNQDLTYKIGQFHAAALDEIGSLYYSGEGYDDFYYGKGSTYPDINGCVGILFEQASSRGHLQETDNGLLSFPFTVRNQVTTALSTLTAFGELRNDLLTYQREFLQEAYAGSTGYLVDTDGDQGRARELMDLLRIHDIPAKQNGDGRDVKEIFVYETPASRAFFEPITEFEDSLFYDVSTFVLPYAFNLPYRKVSGGLPRGGDWMPTGGTTIANELQGTVRAKYAYLLPWDDYYSAKALYQLLDEELIVKVSDKSFSVEGEDYGPGSIIVPVENNQEQTPEEIYAIIQRVEREVGIPFVPLAGGRVSKGLMLGSRSAYQTLRKPEVAIIVEGGTASLEVADAWHLLDQRFNIPVTKLPMDRVGRTDLDRYNTIIMVDGNYGDLGSAGTDALKEWMGSDRVLITLKRAAYWAKSAGISKAAVRNAPNPDKDDESRRPYSRYARDGGGKVLGGAIFEAEGDLSHPLLFGMQRADIPVFKRSTLLFDLPNNYYASPLTFGDNALLSGYSPRGFEEELAGTAGIVVSGYRGGRVISFADNPNFRAFWYGTNRLFMNAIMFGHTISGRATE
ncbi:zinc carboxypeptidase [Lewinella sp. 4G2]|nr:zinc carboxypeptidase [Lewinella sp. 4G2]